MYKVNHLNPILPNEGSGSSIDSLFKLTDINKILTKANATHAAE
jgi:hypothetical protein